MAKNIEEVLNREIKSIKDLRDAIKEYQNSLIGVDAESEEFKNTTEMLRAAQDELTKVTRAGKDAYDAATDSIVGMEREYKELYNQYKLLDEAQRNSDFGKNMAESLKTLSDKINETKQGVGNFKDNIGRYTSSIMDAFKQMGGSVGGLVGPFATATKGVQAFNTALKANPIGAVVTLILSLVNALKGLSSSFKSNEESQMRLNQAMASFQPIIDAAKNAMDRFAQAVLSVIEFVANVVDKIRVAKAAFTDFLGITKGAKDAVKEQQKVYKELAASVNDLTLKKREYQKANAADKAEVERLREEASETTNLAEKKELLQQAKEIQAQIDERNIEVAKEELRILEEQAKLTANDAAMNDKLAAAVAKVSEAEAQAAANARNFNKQLKSTTSTAGGAATAMHNYKEEAKKIYEQTLENAKSEVQKLTEKYEKEKKLLEKYHYDTTLLTKQYNKDMEKLYAEAAKSAADAASKAYVDAAKRRIGTDEFSFLSEQLQTEIDGVFQGVRQMEAKKKEYQRFLEDFFSLDPALEGFKEQGESFVREINEILGTDIQFPPEIDDASMSQFKEKLKDAESLFDLAIKRMEAKGKELIILDTIDIGEKDALNNKINTLITSNLDVDSYQFYLDAKERIDREELEMERRKWGEILEIQNLSQADRLEALRHYYELLERERMEDWEKQVALEELKTERLAELWDSGFGAYNDITSSINSVIGSFSQLMKAEVDSGKLTEKEAEKKKKTLEKLAKVQLAVTIAQIAASTSQGIMDVWKGYAAETASNAVVAAAAGIGAPAALAALNTKSLASAILKTAGLGANAIAQIAAARGGYVSTVNNLRDSGGGGSVAASVSTPAEIESMPFTYTRQAQTFEEEERLNRPMFVSVTDINNVQNRVQVTEEESSW